MEMASEGSLHRAWQGWLGGETGHQGGPPGTDWARAPVWTLPSHTETLAHCTKAQSWGPSAGLEGGRRDAEAQPQGWLQQTSCPEVPSQRPEPLNAPPGVRVIPVSLFTPTVSASESFNLTADCIKIPVVIGSGAVFSMRILNQAFCPASRAVRLNIKTQEMAATENFTPLNSPHS